MVSRRTESGRPFAPQEALSVEEAMRCYTLGSAVATRTEADRGTLRVGKLADVVVLGADPRVLGDDPAAIAEVPVVATFVGGELRHAS